MRARSVSSGTLYSIIKPIVGEIVQAVVAVSLTAVANRIAARHHAPPPSTTNHRDATRHWNLDQYCICCSVLHSFLSDFGIIFSKRFLINEAMLG